MLEHEKGLAYTPGVRSTATGSRGFVAGGGKPDDQRGVATSRHVKSLHAKSSASLLLIALKSRSLSIETRISTGRRGFSHLVSDTFRIRQ